MTSTAVSYEWVNGATVETEKFSVNVESSQLSKNMQSLLRLLFHSCIMLCKAFFIQHNAKVLE